MDLDVRKTIHIKLLTDTHAGLKVQSALMKLSMQAILEELALKVVECDPYFMDILKEASRRKRTKQVQELASTDADTLLNYLEDTEESK